MNKERLMELADHIEAVGYQRIVKRKGTNPEAQFDMRQWVHECGAPGCIAGHGVNHFEPDTYQECLKLQEGPDEDVNAMQTAISREAQRILDLDYLTACRLFNPHAIDNVYDSGPDKAADVLRKLAAGQGVTWFSPRVRAEFGV